MFFRRKLARRDIPSGNIRRRFHHLLISKRHESLTRTAIARPRRWGRLRAQPGLSDSAKKTLFVGLSSILLLGATYLAFFSSFFLIDSVDLQKNGESVPAAALAPFLEKLKGKNLLFLQPAELSKEIQAAFPYEIIRVKTEKSLPSHATMLVEEYPPRLKVHVLTADQEQNFVINETGFAIEEGDRGTALSTLEITSEKPLRAHTVILPPQKTADILLVFRRFEELFNMKVPKGVWKKTERELHITTEKGFTVWIDLTSDIERQLAKLKRALPKLDIYREPLEYIDLRIAGIQGEKVIFKRK